MGGRAVSIKKIAETILKCVKKLKPKSYSDIEIFLKKNKKNNLKNEIFQNFSTKSGL